jgi:hypothetical protein
VRDGLPAPDGFFPGAPEMMRLLLKNTSPETVSKVMAGGALNFCGMR